jgi:pimeloyl-ACP methyl ester carboxylesterase
MLLADADAALAHLGEATVLGRGLGAYVALQLAGARPAVVMGALLCDGPGLAGGPTEPTSQSIVSLPHDGTTPDPYALVELGRDLRPPDYATSFVRLAVQGSTLDDPITVSAVYRPAWLEAVAAEYGVADRPVAEALEAYAGSSPRPAG